MAEKIERTVLEPRLFADIVKMVLKNFLQMTTNRKLTGRDGCLVIDVELITNAGPGFYAVQLTYCGRWTDQGIRSLFHEFCSLVKNGCLPNNAVLANAFARKAGEESETVWVMQGAPDFHCKTFTATNGSIHFPSFRYYTLIKLQYIISSQFLAEFKEILILEFEVWRKSHPNVKITFYSGKDVFYSNHVESDEDFQDCQSLSLPLITIVKQTMNSRFKERCLQSLGVDNSHDAQKFIGRKLFSMVHENYMLPR